MTTRKSQNSILVLATLGVFLGLVLVGATPQVMAQAAMTKQFSVKDEIEYKDDLHKKPDDGVATLSDSVNVYLADVEYFLSELKRFRDDGKFDLESDVFEVTQTTLLPCVPGNKVGSYAANTFVAPNDRLRRPLENFSKHLTDGYSLADCLPSEQFQGAEATHSKFTFNLDRSAFNVEVAVKKYSAGVSRAVTSDLERTLALFRPKAADAIRQRVFENTRFSSINDQIFIITRLPRSGLDSLFTSNAR